MCGIIGFYNFNLSIDHLLDQQKFRGPDANGSCEISINGHEKLTLGHNRLKIICLSDIANQPYIDSSKQHYLVFNGEIYNYLEIREELSGLGIKTVTNSDTEVLLLALKTWGIDAVNKFNGMFAFAYFDSKNLYLVRDRFGVKPLYYYHENNRVLFASTSSVIAKACELKPNYSYLQFGIQYSIYQDNTESTAYEQLHSVPAGHYLVFSLDKTCKRSIVEYYNLELRVKQKVNLINELPRNKLHEATSELIYNATRLRLHSDVPVAVAMSGGLDSSIIAGLAKQMKSDLVGFCFGSLDDPLSEAVLAQQTADLNKMNLIFVNADSDDWLEALLDTLKYQDSPFCGLSVVAQFLLYKKIKEHGYKVVLGGQGGDESFLGYRKFQLIYLKELIAHNNWASALRFLNGFYKLIWAEKANFSKYWRMRSKYTKPQGFTSQLSLPGEPSYLTVGFNHGIRARQIADIVQSSLPTLLRYEDRNSMAHGIESRLPFMDYRLIELACSLPVDMLLQNGYGKAILRDNFKDIVPQDIRLARYKRGFDVSRNKEILSALLPRLSGRISEVQNKLSTLFHSKIDTTRYSNIKTFESSANHFTELMTLLWLNEKL